MRFQLIEAEKANYPVKVLCEVMDVSRSGFYAWLERPPCDRAKEDARLGAAIEDVHRRTHRRYGSPRVHADLQARGVCVSRKRVARLMRERGLVGRRKRRFRKTTDSNHQDPIAPNILNRCFEAEAPNQVWVTDVTYLATGEGWAYLAVILDLFSRRVVGWAVSAFNDRALALEALQCAIRERGPVPGLIHHSDRGSPYASNDYRDFLEKHGIIASMSRKGDCWDNAVAESFFATLRAELVDDEHYPTRAVATRSVGEYIDGFYNPERRHSTLEYVNPMEYELKAQLAAAAA